MWNVDSFAVTGAFGERRRLVEQWLEKNNLLRSKSEIFYGKVSTTRPGKAHHKVVCRSCCAANQYAASLYRLSTSHHHRPFGAASQKAHSLYTVRRLCQICEVHQAQSKATNDVGGSDRYAEFMQGRSIDAERARLPPLRATRLSMPWHATSATGINTCP